MGTPVIQATFTGGELTPKMYGRVDLQRWQSSVKTCRNFMVLPWGGVANRPGTKFIAPVWDSSAITRLIPFQFSTTQNYILEFGDQTMRVYKDGGLVLEPAKTITDITEADPAVVTSATHGFSNGDWVYIQLVGGMSEVNGKFYIISAVTTNTFVLNDLYGNQINSSAFTAYTSGGQALRVYKTTTPYADTDLAALNFVQSADTMFFAHPDYAQRSLTRTDHHVWSFSTLTFAPQQAAPTGAPGLSGGEVGTTTKYVVTAVSSDEHGDESIASAIATATNTEPTDANPITVDISGIVPAGNIAHYNVYKAKNDVYGYIGSTPSTSFIDDNIAPVLTDTPPETRNPFSGADDKPGAVAFYEERLAWAGSDNNPQSLWTSQSGSYYNMTVSQPPKDDDAVTFTIAAREVNRIRHLVPMSDLLALTSGGVWRISGGNEGDPLTPTSVRIKIQTYDGASIVRPLVVGATALFVQDDNKVIRDISYQYEVDGYDGNELTLLAEHLTEARDISDWDYQKRPYSIVWVICSDGTLLGLTYKKEHEIWGWHQHTTDGTFESVATIREGGVDIPYFVIRRTIDTLGAPKTITDVTSDAPGQITIASHGWMNGDRIYITGVVGQDALNDKHFVIAGVTTNTFTLKDDVTGEAIDTTGMPAYVSGGQARKVTQSVRRYVERMHDRQFTAVEDAIFLDSYLTYSGAPVSSISGLDHLDGELVSVLGDGNVEENKRVIEGAISLTQSYSKVHVGLPYTARLETLDLDLGNVAGTVQASRIRINEVTLRLDKSRGIRVGTSDDRLVLSKPDRHPAYDTAIALFTGDRDITLDSGWDDHGSVIVEQPYPLPLHIVALMPHIRVSTPGDAQ